MSHRRKIAAVGLGYVELAVAAAFARAGSPVVGFDIDHTTVRELKAGEDRTREVEPSDLKLPSLSFSCKSSTFQDSDFFIVTVPTPIDAARRPDLGAMFEASRMAGSALKKSGFMVYESTVYPARSRKSACRSWSKLRTVTRCPTASSCGGSGA
jgi:UDP-N-acetyl-D-glucosamine/UDP-N-acetyl-D-galactosamine dehydrogenase